MTHFILVHGAWHGGWCWDRLTPLLEAAGHRVSAPDLPGHGKRRRWPRLVSMETYISAVKKEISACDEKVVLVGHSMGGMVITGAAARIPDQVKACVYLCAFLPPSGKSLADLAPDASPITPDDSTIGWLSGGIRIKPERAVPIFYGDCSEADRAFALSRLCRQSARAFADRVSYSAEQFGSVRKFYIKCMRDQAIHPVAQEKMAQAGGVEEIQSLDADHSPFFSAPQKLADILAAWSDKIQ